jgi:uncharacterized membrane protein (UPF0127 family)
MSALASFLRARRAFLAGAVALIFLHGAAVAASIERLEIVTRSGVVVIEVEIAVTDEERAQGLMFRRELPEGRGMLFDFRGEGPVTMWMKNTYVSLDMFFIRADGTIARIAENTEPLSEAHIVSGAPVQAVLEVLAGTAKRLGIRAGDKVGHRIFGGR